MMMLTPFVLMMRMTSFVLMMMMLTSFVLMIELMMNKLRQIQMKRKIPQYGQHMRILLVPSLVTENP